MSRQRMECVQLAAAFGRTVMSRSHPPTFVVHRHSTAAASCTHSIRFARFEPEATSSHKTFENQNLQMCYLEAALNLFQLSNPTDHFIVAQALGFDAEF